MLKLQLVDGSTVWLSVLAIRCVTPNRMGEAEQCEVFTDATTRYTVVGRAEVIANHAASVMRSLYRQD